MEQPSCDYEGERHMPRTTEKEDRRSFNAYRFLCNQSSILAWIAYLQVPCYMRKNKALFDQIPVLSTSCNPN